jgi:hypothetical protein
MTDKTKQGKIDALLGRALRDKDFRQKLVDDPKAAAEESELSADDLDLVAGGLAMAGLKPGQIMYCTAKTCNEKGGARVANPGEAISNPAINIANKLKGGG